MAPWLQVGAAGLLGGQAPLGTPCGDKSNYPGALHRRFLRSPPGATGRPLWPFWWARAPLAGCLACSGRGGLSLHAWRVSACLWWGRSTSRARRREPWTLPGVRRHLLCHLAPCRRSGGAWWSCACRGGVVGPFPQLLLALNYLAGLGTARHFGGTRRRCFGAADHYTQPCPGAALQPSPGGQGWACAMDTGLLWSSLGGASVGSVPACCQCAPRASACMPVAAYQRHLGDGIPSLRGVA